MTGKYLQLIEELTQAPGAPGFEDAVIKIARAYCAGFAPLQEDSIRNLYIGRYKNDGKKPLLMLDAHSDEVAFLIKSINSNGTLGMISLGGINPGKHEGARVLVRNADGQYIPGLISCRPPHYGRDAAEQLPVVDIGARGANEAARDFRIRIGEPCVPDVAF